MWTDFQICISVPLSNMYISHPERLLNYVLCTFILRRVFYSVKMFGILMPDLANFHIFD